MNLLDIVRRSAAPAPWTEGDNIPWNDPEFSARMLREHISQEHDAASRRTEKIDRQVAWIHEAALDGQPGTVLDLGCGPGFYSSRLARLGHSCTGIDFSPASIAYAEATAARDGLDCAYRLEDLRAAGYGDGWDLVMLIFGEFNVFKPEDARAILRRAHDALAPYGYLLLEPHTFTAIAALGARASAWHSSAAGLFAAVPHLLLTENFWDEAAAVATTRWFVVDAASGEVTRYAASYQAYTEAQYSALLESCGFVDVRFFPSLLGGPDPEQPDFCAILARA